MRRRLRPVDGIPLARVTIAAQVALGLVLCVWMFTSSGLRLPFADSAYVLHATLPDGAGLDEKDHPSVTVGGVKSGFVTAVSYDTATGDAKVTMHVDRDVRGKLFGDASVTVMPRSVVQDQFVNIDPGDPAAGPLRGTTVRRAGPTPLGYDRALGVLDADTRAYAQVLLGTLRRVVDGRSPELRDALQRTPDVVDSVGLLSRRLAGRRRELTELVADIDKIARATGRRGDQLDRALGAARRTLDVTQAREREIATAISQLPGTLEQADATFSSVTALARPLEPALTSLRPATRALPSGLRALRTTLPALRGTLTDLDRLVRTGRAPLSSLRAATRELGPASRELEGSVPFLESLIKAMADNKPVVSTILKNWPGALSSATALSVITRVIFVRSLPVNPLALGLPKGSTGSASLRRATDDLRRLRPDLFKAPRSGRDAAPPVVAVRALVTQLCKDGNSGACNALSIMYAHPPRMLRP